MRCQREIIYEERNEIIDKEDVRGQLMGMIEMLTEKKAHAWRRAGASTGSLEDKKKTVA